MSRRGVATAAVASLGLLGNVDQARAEEVYVDYKDFKPKKEVDTKVLPGTDVKLFPKESKGLNRFKAMTQDLSKYSPQEQRNIENAWIDYKWNNPYTGTDKFFDLVLAVPAAFMVGNTARLAFNVKSVEMRNKAEFEAKMAAKRKVEVTMKIDQNE